MTDHFLPAKERNTMEKSLKCVMR